MKQNPQNQKTIKNTTKSGIIKDINQLYAYLIIIVFAFILYGNTYYNNYAVDDEIVIKGNSFIQHGLGGIKEILVNDSFLGFFRAQGLDVNLSGGRYRPLSIITFAIEYQFFGLKPHLSHLINVILFGITGLIIYLILLKLFKTSTTDKWYLTIPFIVTLLFLSHPIHTEVIANIKGRDEILAFMGSLYSLFFSIKYIDKKRRMSILKTQNLKT